MIGGLEGRKEKSAVGSDFFIDAKGILISYVLKIPYLRSKLVSESSGNYNDVHACSGSSISYSAEHRERPDSEPV
jgi:hypothetical protein